VKQYFLIPLIAAMAWGAPAAAQTVESAYTDFNLKKCRHTPGKAQEDYGEWRCGGYANIPVWMIAGDQRIMVSYGSRAKQELAATQTLAAFNGEGNRIEWRMATESNGKKRPFATIMRWSTTTTGENGEPVHGEVLVVTRLSPGGVCHVGYVDGRANPDANAIAREIADRHARNFRCGTDKRIVLGNKGPGFSRPYDDE
jgi:hypothetical protein